MNDIGKRMKGYEGIAHFHLCPKIPVVIRVDGRAFHTYTRGCKPFDSRVQGAMLASALGLILDIQNFKLAYVQSDEASFLLDDTDKIESQPWFGYDHSKLVSVSASIFTAYFNAFQDFSNKKAIFDSRAFNMPAHEVPNYFIWRQKDCIRNSLQTFARQFFSHKELHEKNSADIHEMLHGIGQNWTNLAKDFKNGVFILKSNIIDNNIYNYEELKEIIDDHIHAE